MHHCQGSGNCADRGRVEVSLVSFRSMGSPANSVGPGVITTESALGGRGRWSYGTGVLLSQKISLILVGQDFLFHHLSERDGLAIDESTSSVSSSSRANVVPMVEAGPRQFVTERTHCWHYLLPLVWAEPFLLGSHWL